MKILQKPDVATISHAHWARNAYSKEHLLVTELAAAGKHPSVLWKYLKYFTAAIIFHVL